MHTRSKQSADGRRTVKSGAKAGGGSTTAMNKWTLLGKKTKSAWGGALSKGKKPRIKGGAIFLAVMMDTSSDEEEEEEEGLFEGL